jgi:hypothetical protein
METKTVKWKLPKDAVAYFQKLSSTENIVKAEISGDLSEIILTLEDKTQENASQTA